MGITYRNNAVRRVYWGSRIIWDRADHAGGPLYIMAATDNKTRIGSASNWVDVATGAGTSWAAVNAAGELWTWGNNSNGQLGLGDKTTRANPTRVGTDTNWIKVFGSSTVNGHFWAIKSNGALYASGDTDKSNSSGVAYDSNNRVFAQVTAIPNCAFAVGCNMLSANAYSLFIDTDGNLWGTGGNPNRQFGIGGQDKLLSPAPIFSAEKVVACACGPSANFVVTASGKMYVAGWTAGGSVAALGDGDTTNHYVSNWTQIGSDKAWKDVIMLASYQGLAITTSNEVYGWGQDLAKTPSTYMGSGITGFIHRPSCNVRVYCRTAGGQVIDYDLYTSGSPYLRQQAVISTASLGVMTAGGGTSSSAKNIYGIDI